MVFGSEPLTRRAGVAQLVEQLIRNQQVAGSNPVTSSKQKNVPCGRFFVCGERDLN